MTELNTYLEDLSLRDQLLGNLLEHEKLTGHDSFLSLVLCFDSLKHCFYLLHCKCHLCRVLFIRGLVRYLLCDFSGFVPI